ncbi:MAG TPA: hypothetical protein PLU53_02020 [Bacteroidia bacterium]|nr:hypothetical protein [Bacteroidia bacterium]
MSGEIQSNDYKPGVCNIGQRELSVRKKFLNIFLPATVLLSAASFFLDSSLILWILLLISTFCMIVLYLELKFKFCIIFGFFSLYNFEKLGTIHEVKNQAHQSSDRKRVLEIVIQSFLFSLIYATSLHLIAGYLNVH